MIKEAIVLLMFFGAPIELQEFTVRDGLSECLKAKRTIERNVKGPSQTEYTGTMRLACKKFDVELSEHGSIIKFINADPFQLK